MAKHDRGVVNGRAFRSGCLALLAAPLAVEAPRAGSRGRLTPSDLEVGLKKNPSLDVLKRLAKAFGVPVTELLE
jgi:transcriptional regulator with XRE-family HTH domain